MFACITIIFCNVLIVIVICSYFTFALWFREPGRPGLTVTPSKPRSFSSHVTLKLTNEKSVFGGTQAFH